MTEATKELDADVGTVVGAVDGVGRCDDSGGRCEPGHGLLLGPWRCTVPSLT